MEVQYERVIHSSRMLHFQFERFDSALVKVTFDNWTQSLKHYSQNVWIEFGIVISSRFLQLSKAEIEISFYTSLAGKWIIVRFSRPLNVFALILCINPCSPNSRVWRKAQPSNASDSIVSNESGNVTLINEKQW